MGRWPLQWIGWSLLLSHEACFCVAVQELADATEEAVRQLQKVLPRGSAGGCREGWSPAASDEG